jgi:hypothetical protein
MSVKVLDPAATLKVLDSVDFAMTSIERALDAPTQEEALEEFRRVRNAIEYVVMVLEGRDAN